MYVVLKKGYTKNEAKMQSRCQELKNKQDMECWSRKTTDRKEERVERREGKKKWEEIVGYQIARLQGWSFPNTMNLYYTIMSLEVR